MSDIYLQITETPTVVTLSAPVVSGALASTVTVANTVTVALDANSLSALENVTVTVGAAVTISNFPSSQAVTFSNLALTDTQLRASAVTIGGTVTANVFGQAVIGSANFPIPIIGYDEDITSADFQITVPVQISSLNGSVGSSNPLPISGTVTIGSALPTGTNRIGVVTIGGGTVTLGAGTAQIGSVTASISGTVPVSGTFWQATQPVSGTFFQATQPVSLTSTTVTVSSLPALAAGTAQIGSVTASISNSVVTFYPLQGTTVTNTNFTSITPSTTLVSAVAGREVLTVFNEGAGNLHISAGGICTTTAYQARLAAGDYWECPAGQLSLAHTAVFATAGTARVTEIS